MKVIVFGALGLLLLCFLFVWSLGYIRYHITPRHVKILWFGFCLRRIAIANISSVSKRRSSGLAENWWSTLNPKHRALVIRRKRGLLKNVVITPRNRYAFKFELEQSIERLKAPPEEVAQKAPIFVD